MTTRSPQLPEVTDQMIVKVIEMAASPVCLWISWPIRFPVSSDAGRHRILQIVEDLDDRIIFLWINGEENPDQVERLAGPELGHKPCALIFLREKLLYRWVDVCDGPGLRMLLDLALGDAAR